MVQYGLYVECLLTGKYGQKNEIRNKNSNMKFIYYRSYKKIVAKPRQNFLR